MTITGFRQMYYPMVYVENRVRLADQHPFYSLMRNSKGGYRFLSGVSRFVSNYGTISLLFLSSLDIL